jgi:hypothetical protein
MPKVLNKKDVQDWLIGQNAAAERIKSERVSFLMSLTPENSLQIYLELKRLGSGERSQAPSRLIWAMRRAIAQLGNTQKDHESP